MSRNLGWHSFLLCSGLAVLIRSGIAVSADEKPGKSTEPLVIHEWGTFTCLQDEAGRSIGGVNTDDEAVPKFVHRISDLIPEPSDLAPVYYKGVPRSHRNVHMRLETPVVYFHPPAGTRDPLHVTLKVGFRGGWLTEYYPRADVDAPGLGQGNFNYGKLTPETLGTLAWNDLTIGAGGELPQTEAPVWLAPREVSAATVRVPGGEAEKYLFYRGVGNIRSPLKVTHDSDHLVIREDLDPKLSISSPLPLREIWIVHVRESETVAYKSLGSATFTGEQGRAITRVKLPGHGDAAHRSRAADQIFETYSTKNLTRLRTEMRVALIADGLFEDEADAMLKTWELAYFKSPGLRLFYLLPQQWTDAVLPLECDHPARVVRTMVGRVEIVTPKQRALLKEINHSDIAGTDWFFRTVDSLADRNAAFARLWEGKVRLGELEVAIPDEYKAYLALGRFRNALLLEEEARERRDGIRRFNEAYGIRYYTPVEPEAKTAATE